MRLPPLFLGLYGLVLAAAAPSGVAAQGFAPPLVLTIEVDAREAPRHLLHARISYDAEQGPLVLSYPKWLPGDHGPSGPISNIVGLRFTQDGRPLTWERDSLDWWTVRVASTHGRVVAELDYADVTAGTIGTTARLGIVTWSSLLLLPGIDAARLRAEVTLRIPPGWSAAGALPMTPEGDGTTLRLAPSSVVTLIDSPVLIGRHGTTIDLAPGHRIALYGDTPESIVPSPELVAGWKRLVAEGLALFGGRAPYRHYTFLVALSDAIDHFGIESEESSVNRVPERMLLDEAPRVFNASLLPHEYVHAWNGKWRRPAGLLSPDYAAAMKPELLWIYEGLTEYWGWVLAARSGLLSPEEARDELALTAAVMDSRAGRAWRPLRDAGTAAHLQYEAESAFTSMRRGTDFYGEAQLVWLEVDATIRARSKGRRSLDDFARTFFAPAAPPAATVEGPLPVSPYVVDEVVAALNAIEAFDWSAFFVERVDRIAPRAPLGGLEQAGSTLAYRDSMSDYLSSYEELIEKTDLRFSLGVRVDEDGALDDVIPDSPAGRAGLAPGEVLVAVNDRAWTARVLKDALKATARDASAPLELTVKSGTFLRRVALVGVRGDRRP
ncbi:MAG: PDZ domain-containing protein, partial [Candidatus Eisenbacteria bacterium]